MKKPQVYILSLLAAAVLGVSGCSSTHGKAASGRRGDTTTAEMGDARPTKKKARKTVAKVEAPAPELALDEETSTEATPEDIQAENAAMMREVDARLVQAFEQVLAEYGNPTVCRVYTNDPAKGASLSRRLKMLQNTEALRREVAGARAELAKLTRQIEARNSEIVALDDRLARRRAALKSFVEMAETAQRAFDNADEDQAAMDDDAEGSFVAAEIHGAKPRNRNMSEDAQ